ncbi:unnamed protein product [Lota lota]
MAVLRCALRYDVVMAARQENQCRSRSSTGDSVVPTGGPERGSTPQHRSAEDGIITPLSPSTGGEDSALCCTGSPALHGSALQDSLLWAVGADYSPSVSFSFLRKVQPPCADVRPSVWSSVAHK